MAKIITTEELEKHNKKDDIWVALHGKVYDISGFHSHPGGYDKLLKNAGTDVSEVFDKQGHPKDAEAKLRSEAYLGEYK